MRKLILIKCPYCDKDIKSSAFKTHVTFKHNITAVECDKIKLNILVSKEIQEKIVYDYSINELTIKNLIEKYDIPMGVISLVLHGHNVKFRNAKESHNTKQYIKNYETTSLKNSGYKNPSSNPEIKARKIQTMLKNHKRINNFQDKKIQEKAEKNIDREKSWESIKQKIFLKYGVTNFGQVNWREKWNTKIEKMTDEEKEEYFRDLSGRMRKNLHGWTSKLETKIQEILNDLNVEYINNKYLHGYNFDIIFPNKCILEIQGDFWHANPNIYNANDILNFPKKKKIAKEIWKYDKKKKDTIEKHGYKVFYIWESELGKMESYEVINFIDNILNYNGTKNN